MCFWQETIDINDEDGAEPGLGHSKSSRKKKRRLPRTVVNPDGNFYFYWLFLLTFCVLYNLWTLIVRQTFPELQVRHINFSLSSSLYTDNSPTLRYLTLSSSSFIQPVTDSLLPPLPLFIPRPQTHTFQQPTPLLLTYYYHLYYYYSLSTFPFVFPIHGETNPAALATTTAKPFGACKFFKKLVQLP